MNLPKCQGAVKVMLITLMSHSWPWAGDGRWCLISRKWAKRVPGPPTAGRLRSDDLIRLRRVRPVWNILSRVGGLHPRDAAGAQGNDQNVVLGLEHLGQFPSPRPPRGR